METVPAAPPHVNPASVDPVTAGRIKTLAVLLVVTVLPTIVIGLLWNGPEETNELYS